MARNRNATASLQVGQIRENSRGSTALSSTMRSLRSGYMEV
jgi:hypothetical protein